MVQHPTSKYVKSLQDTLMSIAEPDKEQEISEIDYIREWIAVEFGARWLDLEITEEDLKKN